MAYRPSQRRTIEAEPAEPNLTPIMNLMVVLIPLLLTSAEYIKLGVIELNLPPAAGPLTSSEQIVVEQKRSLGLTISITDAKVFISWQIEIASLGKNVILDFGSSQINFEEISSVLLKLKTHLPPDFANERNVVLQAESEVNYQTLVSVMDALRMVKVDGEDIELFPDIQLSAGII